MQNRISVDKVLEELAGEKRNFFFSRCLRDFPLNEENKLYVYNDNTYLLLFHRVIAHLYVKDVSGFTKEERSSVIRILEENPVRTVFGPSESLCLMKEHLHTYKENESILMLLDLKDARLHRTSAEILQTKKEFSHLLSFYREQEDYKESFPPEEDEAYTESMLSIPYSKTHYVAAMKNKEGIILSSATLNSFMIVNVATKKEERMKGHALSCLYKIINSLILNKTEEEVVLLCRKVLADTLYRKAGFTELGNFMSLKKEEEK